MKRWLYIVAAVCSEVVGSLSLKAAQEHPAWYVSVVVGFVGAFVFLLAVLRLGVAVGVAYGIWGALGVSLTAVLSSLVFGEPFTAAIGLGTALIVVGVLLIELGSHPAGGEAGGREGASA